MITHSIIKSRERWRVLNTGGAVEIPPANANSAPLLLHPLKPMICQTLPFTYSEDEYNQYLKDIGIQVGDFVCNRRAQSIYSTASIGYVVYIRPFAKRTNIRMWSENHPQVIWVVQAMPTTPTGHDRWETVADVRKVTESEYKTWIEANIDRIRDYVKRYDAIVAKIDETTK